MILTFTLAGKFTGVIFEQAYPYFDKDNVVCTFTCTAALFDQEYQITWLCTLSSTALEEHVGLSSCTVTGPHLYSIQESCAYIQKTVSPDMIDGYQELIETAAFQFLER